MLRTITDGVWAHDQDLALPGRLLLPSRATLIRRPDGGLVLHSPLRIDDETAKEIAALGDVRSIVAPSRIHYLFLKAAMERYPRATVFGPPGLEKKVSGLDFVPLPTSGEVAALGDLRIR